MINLSNLHSLPEYATDLASFNSVPVNRRKWSVFKNSHMKASNNKCPICECPLDTPITRPSNNNSVIIEPTIDHYRPIDKYPNLKYDHENYILMCKDCNGPYKGSEFPLHSSTPNRNTTATETSNISNEKPLIVNPIYDDIHDIFKLVFKQSHSGKKVLELAPKQTSGYNKERAEETIRLFSLGNCEEPSHRHSSINVQACRIGLLHNHFLKFYNIVRILNGRNITQISKKDQKEIYLDVKSSDLDEFGFYKFIFHNNYINLIP